ncbi:MAG: M48 family metallopeptidase [Pseudomonadota bacterium]
MIKFLPFLLIAIGAYVMVRFSAWRMGAGLKSRSRPLQNDALERLIDRLAETAGIDRIRVRVLDDPSINGLATPDGGIYLTRGLLQKHQAGMITATEIGSIVAHELGHLALGHTKRRMIDVTAAQTATIVLGGILARFIPFIGWWIAQATIGLFVSRISRGDEFQADAYATALMLRAGYGAEPQARMLEKLESLIPGAAEAAASQVTWLASHPPASERAAAIRENARRWGAAPHGA